MAVVSDFPRTDFIEQVAHEAARDAGYMELKPEQVKAIVEFVRGRDVFVSLPTGFGKSLIYGLLPIVLERLLQKPKQCSVAIVISPLSSLMIDQKARFLPRGISAEFIGEMQHDDLAMKRIKDGEHQLVLMTPENLFHGSGVRDLLMYRSFQEKIVAFVIDEAHCIQKWGKQFRQDYDRLGELRSILPSHVPAMALTATASYAVYETAVTVLGMKDPVLVAAPPSRSNIFFSVVRKKELVDIAKDIAVQVHKLAKEDPRKYPKTIIFCRRCEDCGTMYHYLSLLLKDLFVFPRGSDAVPGRRFAEIYTRASTVGLREAVIEAFQPVDSCLRIVFATIAFGMGLDVADIQQIIHIGPSSDIDDYAQEVGRGGRNGLPCKAILIRKETKYASNNMLNYIQNASQCRRVFIFKQFVGGKEVRPVEPKCACCDYCAVLCKCGACSQSVFHTSAFLYSCD